VKQQLRVLDSDMHVMEPPDLWQRYIAPEFRERAPHGTSTGPLDLALYGPDERPWGRHRGASTGDTTAAGHWPRPGGPTRLQRKFQAQFERGWTPEVQLEAMDAEGLDVAVLYPSRALFALSIPDLDPPFAAALARAYNDWLHDFCRADPRRLLGAGLISPFEVADAVAETRRCVTELGFRGIFLRPNIVNGRNWHDPYFDPLWSTLEELDVPLGFHEGSGTKLRQVGDHFGDGTMLRHVVCHPLEMMLATVSFCGGGTLERHPRLKVAFLEGNCGWVPFLLWRLDEHWQNLGEVYPSELTMAPSEYFKRQCFVSVEADEAPVKYVLDAIGDRQLVFSTDFPHFDSKFPHAVDAFLTLPLAEETQRRILWDNCAAYYGLSAPSPLPKGEGTGRQEDR
jgi:predicted TIM-barrel fold metal-dependent hydrolase